MGHTKKREKVRGKWRTE